MSLVAWHVGQHLDTIHKKGEYVENKMLLVMPSRDGPMGRGRSLLKTNMCSHCWIGQIDPMMPEGCMLPMPMTWV